MADDAVIEPILNSIAGIESGGKYNAIGPATKGDRPYGKYQVMGRNIPAWTKEALGAEMPPSQFLSNPDAQEKTVRHQIGKLYDQYGNPEDVASVWHSGKPLAEAGGRQDVLGTKTTDYAAKVGAESGLSAPDDTSNNTIVTLPDGREIDLGVNPSPELQAQVRDKIRADFPDLAKPAAPPVDEANQSTRDMTPDEFASHVNRGAGKDDNHWIGRYTAAVAKPLADAMGDFADALKGGGDLTSLPKAGMPLTDDLKQRGETVLKFLRPLGALGEAGGNLAWQAAMDAGLSADTAAVLGTLASVGVGLGTPLIPGLGKAAGEAGTVIRGGEEAAAAATAAQEASTAAQAARQTAQDAATAVAPGAEAKAAAEAALSPIEKPIAGGALKTGSEAGHQAVRADVKGLYNAVTEGMKDAAITPDSDEAEKLFANITNLREANGARFIEPKVPGEVGKWEGGLITGQPKQILDEMEAALQSGEPIPYPQMETFKRMIDTVTKPRVPVGATSKEAALTQFRHDLRGLMRDKIEEVDPNLAKTFDEANTRWDQEVLPAEKFARKIAKSDDAVAFDSVFGEGKRSQNAANARRALQQSGDPDTMRSGFFGHMIDKATEGDALHLNKLLKHYDSLDSGFRDTMMTPGAKSFFEGVRDQLGAAERGEQWAKAAEGVASEAGKMAATAAKGAEAAAAKAGEIPKWARITARGLHMMGSGAAGSMFGHGPAGAIGGFLIPNEALARALANSKTANLLARAIKTPLSSQIIPTLLNSIRDAGVSVEYLNPETEGDESLPPEQRGTILGTLAKDVKSTFTKE